MTTHNADSQTQLPFFTEAVPGKESSQSTFIVAPQNAPASASAPSPVRDIVPRTPVASLHREYPSHNLEETFDIQLVAALVGMSSTYIRRVLNRNRLTAVSLRDVLLLLDLDAFAETFVPRSKIPDYLLSYSQTRSNTDVPIEPLALSACEGYQLINGSAKDLIQRLALQSVQCVVTSTPYWGTRLYEDWFEVTWADGETCPFGHEQTPEGFIRHTVELLYLLKPAMTVDGSIWWNLMDTYNTRTQIRSNAAETLRAMRGQDERSWRDYECRRYSAGHSFLEDGEQCLIPARVAERASRIGYLTKSIITWKKISSMPETVGTRVTREAEYILHLAVQRAPYFNKESYVRLPAEVGGRNREYEAEKLTDVWSLPTSNGLDGHGAQFPLSLPGRCIALSTRSDDIVLDPFIGSGTTAVAAIQLARRVVGFDISETYLHLARHRIARAAPVEQLRLMLEQAAMYTPITDMFAEDIEPDHLSWE